MIRGPILPQLRESLWTLVSTRLDTVERGLTLVLEGLDCSGGQLGAVEGLARDASGAPVLVLLAVDGDALLPARALSASDFLLRVGDALVTAVPEAKLCPGVPGRVLVIGTEAATVSLDQLGRLPVPGLHVCRLEPFRIAGSERFAVRWMTPAPGAELTPEPAPDAPSFVVPEEQRDLWSTVHALCTRVDPGVRVDGDRYWRRISWRGRSLAEVRLVDGIMQATLADGSQRDLLGVADVKPFIDLLLRQFAALAGLSHTQRPAAGGSNPARDPASRHAANGRNGALRTPAESLRSAAAAARLSPEEYSALGGPALAAGGDTEAAAMADDDDSGVAAQDGPWPPPRRPD